MRRMGTVLVVAIGVAGLSWPASATAEAKTPSAKRVAKMAVRELGPEAILATFLALDQGYSTSQVVDGVRDRALEPTGAILKENGRQVAPDGPTAGVITGAAASAAEGDDLHVPVAIDTVRDALPGADPAAVSALTNIVLASARGYPADQVLVDGFLENGWETFGAGKIKGVPKPRAVPDPDLLDELLTGIEKAERATSDRPKRERATNPDRFVGTLTLGDGWTNRYGVGTPVIGESRIELGIRGDRLFGKFSLVLENPQVGGNCTIRVTFDAKIGFVSDGTGWTAQAQGSASYVTRDAAGCSTWADEPVNWDTSVLRTADDRLSGQMSYVGSGRTGMTVAFEATAR